VATHDEAVAQERVLSRELAAVFASPGSGELTEVHVVPDRVSIMPTGTSLLFRYSPTATHEVGELQTTDCNVAKGLGDGPGAAFPGTGACNAVHVPPDSVTTTAWVKAPVVVYWPTATQDVAVGQETA
jgi:hypothetical protein